MKNLLKNILKLFGYKLQSTKYEIELLNNEETKIALTFDHVLSKYMLDKQKDQEFNFIQVGAFDGIECDPLRKYLARHNWKGVLIEPQPLAFEKLTQLYSNSRDIKLIQKAISGVNGEQLLYILEGDNLPNWAKGMASFDKSNILKHKNLLHDIESKIVPLPIHTITFEKLFIDYEIKQLDLLQIDTEGYDGEIIKMFPFNKIMPQIIHFEYKHIPLSHLKELVLFLVNKNYRLAIENGEDIIAELK